MSHYTDPHWERSALIVVDLQQDTLDGGPFEIGGTSAIVATATRLVEGFRAARRPVAHVVRLYVPGDRDADLLRREMVEQHRAPLAPGTPGARIAEGVLPRGVDLDATLLLSGAPQHVSAAEAIFYKPRWSAFFRTGLESWLLERGCDTVVVVGCNLPNCPRTTLFDASERDLRAVLVTDAVSQVTAERLADLELIGVRLMSAAVVTARLDGLRASGR